MRESTRKKILVTCGIILAGISIANGCFTLKDNIDKKKAENENNTQQEQEDND